MVKASYVMAPRSGRQKATIEELSLEHPIAALDKPLQPSRPQALLACCWGRLSGSQICVEPYA